MRAINGGVAGSLHSMENRGLMALALSLSWLQYLDEVHVVPVVMGDNGGHV